MVSRQNKYECYLHGIAKSTHYLDIIRYCPHHNNALWQTSQHAKKKHVTLSRYKVSGTITIAINKHIQAPFACAPIAGDIVRWSAHQG